MAFLVWTSLVPFAVALQWQMTDVSMLPIAWAALGNFSVCPSNCRCFPWLSTWNRNLLSQALLSMSSLGLEGHEANEIQAPLGMKNRISVMSRPSCGEPLLKFCFQKRMGAFLCVSPY